MLASPHVESNEELNAHAKFRVLDFSIVVLASPHAGSNEELNAHVSPVFLIIILLAHMHEATTSSIQMVSPVFSIIVLASPHV